MAAIEDNRKAIDCLRMRRSYVETRLSEKIASGFTSRAMENELTAIDYAVSALQFVIQTIEYESAQHQSSR
jgi:hypothetical protein